MTSQKLNLGNYGITLHSQEEQDEKSPLVKKWVCWCCWCKMAGIYNNSYALMTPYKSFQHRLGWKFYKDLYEVIRAQRYLYLPTNLYYQADLWQEDFFILFLLNMPTIPICDLRLLFSFPSRLYQPHIQPWCGNQHELIGWWRMWNKGTFLRCFHIVFQRPYRYFSIALKVILSLSDRFKSFTNDWL